MPNMHPPNHNSPVTCVTYQLFVGIDIAANTATAAWLFANGIFANGIFANGIFANGIFANSKTDTVTSPTQSTKASKPFTFDQTKQGFAHIQQRLQATGISPCDTLVVMEATSTYWIQLASTLHERGYIVSVINPASAHYFARANLKRAKTDNIDALTLAQLAQTLLPSRWTPPPAIYYQLQQCLAQRDTLLSIKGQVHNQLHALSHNVVVASSVQKRMEELIKTLDIQLAAVEADMGELAGADEEWGAAIVQLQSVIGIGLLTACHVVVSTLCFTNSPTPQAVSAYAGLAPMPRQSGSSIRGRSSIGHGGQQRLRTALYMATLSAIRYNPPIKALYERLRAKGKPVKVARCAAARKLLHIAWAIVKQGCMFDPDYKGARPGGHELAHAHQV